MSEIINRVVMSVLGHNGINNKPQLSSLICNEFALTQDRSVFYCSDFAIRFSSSKNVNFSNTVLSLSNLKKIDDRPFFVCLVTPTQNHLFLANSTFLKKISHSSQALLANNIKGSFNGSDILRSFEGIENISVNFERLYDIHQTIGFEGNLIRLVEATNNISPSGSPFEVDEVKRVNILEAPIRAESFVNSPDFNALKMDLDEKVDKFQNEILLASLIENVNVRGRVIEYLIAGEDNELRSSLINALMNKTSSLPSFKTDNALGDYTRVFENYYTETDVKTKIMILNSNPKAYNLDKVLEFLSDPNSVFLFYFVGIDPGKKIVKILTSMFQSELLAGTILLKHWAGRNSRGVSQFEGRTIDRLLARPSVSIDRHESELFLNKLIEL